MFNPPRVSRRTLLRVFAAPGRTNDEVKRAVARYMNFRDDGAIPHWSAVSVRGVFGKRIARKWARYLRHRPATPGLFVQTAYDLGTTPEALVEREPLPTGEMAPSMKAQSGETLNANVGRDRLLCMHDEGSSWYPKDFPR